MLKLILLAGALTGLAPLSAQASESLSLKEAIAIALATPEPAIERHEARARAERDAAISASALPDPMATIGVRNLPIDNFSPDRENMTQFSLNVRQNFPRGNSRNLMADTRGLAADEQRLLAETERRTVIRLVATSWHQIRYAAVAESELKEVRRLLVDLHGQQESSFGAGGKAALSRLFGTELEISLLDDRLMDIRQARARAVAALARYIGADANRPPLLATLPAITPAAFQVLDARLDDHPSLKAASTRTAQAGNRTQLAREAYKPEWGVELGYGSRFGDRADFATALVTFDLPIWTAKKQDPALRAAKFDAQASELAAAAIRLDLQQALRSTLADIEALTDRLAHFDGETIDRAQQVATSLEQAYRAGAADYADLVRAEMTLLDTRLRTEMLRRDIQIRHADLIFLIGENPGDNQ